MQNYLMRCLNCKVILVYLILMVAGTLPSEENPKPKEISVAKWNFLSRERDYLKIKPISNDLRTFIRRYKRRSLRNGRKVKREDDLKQHVFVVRDGNIERLEDLSEVTADIPSVDPSGLGNFTVIPLIIPITVKTFTNVTFCDNFTLYRDDDLPSTESVRKVTDYDDDEKNKSTKQNQTEVVNSIVTSQSSLISNTKTTVTSNLNTAEVIRNDSATKTTIASVLNTTEVIRDDFTTKTTIANLTAAKAITNDTTTKTTIAKLTTADIITDDDTTTKTTIAKLTTADIITDDDTTTKATIASNLTTAEVIRDDSINKTTTAGNLTTEVIRDGDDFISTTSRGMLFLNKVLTDVQELISYEKEGKASGSKEGAMCTVVGDWDSKVGGMQLQITARKEFIHSPIVQLVQQEPEAESGFLMTGNWNITSVLPFNHSSAIILTAISDKIVASFLGDCRICEGTETITGNWMLMHKSANCRDRQNAHAFFSDVMRKDNIRKLHNKHLEEMSTMNLNLSTTTQL